MSDIWQLIVDNYQWVFSGIGVVFIAGVFAFIKKKNSSKISQKQTSGDNSTNIQVGGNVQFTQKND